MTAAAVVYKATGVTHCFARAFHHRPQWRAHAGRTALSLASNLAVAAATLQFPRGRVGARRLGCIRAATAPLSECETQQRPGVSVEEQRLRDWIADAGGFVHEGVAVSFATECGDRGVVATKDMSLEEVSECPLVIIPASLYLSTDAASELLDGVLERNSRAFKQFQRLRKDQQLSLLLAHELRKGEASFYAPYIDMLPPQPPCAWMMDEVALEEKLEGLKNINGLDNFAAVAAAAKHTVMKRSAALADEFGALLCVSAADITWAFGQVVSRSFGNEQDGLGFAPYIDLMNHNGLASKPTGFVGEDGNECVYVPSTWNGAPRALEEGDEVYVSYVEKNPAEMLLSFGFVPSTAAGSQGML